MQKCFNGLKVYNEGGRNENKVEREYKIIENLLRGSQAKPLSFVGHWQVFLPFEWLCGGQRRHNAGFLCFVLLKIAMALRNRRVRERELFSSKGFNFIINEFVQRIYLYPKLANIFNSRLSSLQLHFKVGIKIELTLGPFLNSLLISIQSFSGKGNENQDTSQTKENPIIVLVTNLIHQINFSNLMKVKIDFVQQLNPIDIHIKTNKFIMKVARQRNPYLKRISNNTSHKYSYDIETGKYFLHSENKPDIEINKNGTLKPKYKHYFSGFANHKSRYQQAQKQPAYMHYLPESKYNKSKSFYTPIPDKFAGYAQYPYRITSNFPQHLAKTGQLPKSMTMRKCQSEVKKQINTKKTSSMIMHHSTTTFMNQQEKDKYFNLSFMSMTESKPLPKKAKKTCYNYKCKHLKYFVFDEKQKAEQSTKYSANQFSNTFGMSFHESSLKLEDQESKLISQMN